MNPQEIDAAMPKYEGLVIATASIIERELQERGRPPATLGFDDIKQRLRLKVWKGLTGYDKTRATGPLRKFVFQCVTNEKKDILKSPRRGEDHLADQGPSSTDGEDGPQDAFELRYLSITADEVFARVEGPVSLPSTLTQLELRVVTLLYAEYLHTEIREHLGLSKNGLYAVLEGVHEKLADLRPARTEHDPPPTPPLPRALLSQPSAPSPVAPRPPARGRRVLPTGATQAMPERSPAMIPTAG